MPDSSKIDEFIVTQLRDRARIGFSSGLLFAELRILVSEFSVIDYDDWRTLDKRLRSLRRRGIIRYVPKKQGGNGWEVCDE